MDLFDQPIKFDGLIGSAILRESKTAVAAYNAIPIQADVNLAPALPGPLLDTTLDTTPVGGLIFDGGANHYVALAGVIYGDVAYDRNTRPIKRTYITLLTLDVNVNQPNDPITVQLNFFNKFGEMRSTNVEFICWAEYQLSTQIDENLTILGMGSRKGIFTSNPAVDSLGNLKTLLAIVETLKGSPDVKSAHIKGVFNDGVPVPTVFLPFN